VLLLLALVAVAGLISLIGRLANGGDTALKKTQLSNEAGTELYASFSPDGNRVAYSGRAAGKGDTFHIYVRAVSGGASQQLTTGSATDIGPVWSRDGKRIAFARLLEARTEYLLIPAGGGPEAKAAETGASDEAHQTPSVAWSRDGQALIAVMRAPKQPSWLAAVPASGGEPKKITSPPEGSDGDSLPAVSPDGMSIAFMRRSGPDGGDIWVCDPSGGSLRRVTFDDHPVRGIAWTADGRELVYAGNRMRGWELWRIPVAGGSARRLLDAGRQAQFPTVAPKGRRLLYADSPSAAALWKAELADPSKEKPIVRSPGRESAPSFSADGKKIAFRSDRSGNDEIWVASANGDNPVQVTEMKGARLGRPRWSPDGKLIVFDARTEGRPDLYTVPATGGKATRITAAGSSNPIFSPDGKWIYNGQRQIWRIAPDGGTPKQITQEGGANASPSPDGKWVYYQRGRDIRRVPAEGGTEEEVHTPENNLFWGSLVATNDGVYFLDWQRQTRKLGLSFYQVKEKKRRVVFEMDRVDMDRGASFDISADGKYVVYTKVDQSETNLVLMDGFR
jgi:Tol biopolymer transport system component